MDISFYPTLDHKLHNSKLELMFKVVCPHINSYYGERKQDVDDFMISSRGWAFRSARLQQSKELITWGVLWRHFAPGLFFWFVPQKWAVKWCKPANNKVSPCLRDTRWCVTCMMLQYFVCCSFVACMLLVQRRLMNNAVHQQAVVLYDVIYAFFFVWSFHKHRRNDEGWK